jgi:hypothetical protein
MEESLNNLVNSFTKVDDSTVKTIDLSDLLGKLCGGVFDTDTVELVKKCGAAESTSDKFNLLKEFHNKMKEQNDDGKGKEEMHENLENLENSGNIDQLVQENRSLNSRISNLDSKEQKEFYAKLYQIPTEKDIHIKLDIILEKMEDMQTEMSIIRKQLHSLQKL